MRSVAVALAASLVGAPRLAAQTLEFETRVDSLARVAARTHAAAKAYDDSVGRASQALDTVLAGPPTVLAEQPIATIARTAARSASDSLSRVLGAAMNHLAGYAFVVRVSEPQSWRGPNARAELTLAIVAPHGVSPRGWRSTVDSAGIRSSLRQAIAHAAFNASGPDVFLWAGSVVPTDTVHTSEWADQRLMLVSAPSSVGLRCYHGDLRACKLALQLVPPTDPVLDWHDSTTRRQLVLRSEDFARRIDTTMARECETGSDAACVSLLRQFPAETFREPAAIALRGGLLKHALAMGGTGSVERLLTASNPNPGARLEAAARAPLDSVVAEWQRRVHDTQVPSESLSVGITLMALGWATGIGALSLRSSRWR